MGVFDNISVSMCVSDQQKNGQSNTLINYQSWTVNKKYINQFRMLEKYSVYVAACTANVNLSC